VGECRRTAFFFATLSAVNKSGARQFLSIVKKGCQSSKDILCLKSVLLVHLVVLFSSCVPLLFPFYMQMSHHIVIFSAFCMLTKTS
jgi:hypothetical protein